jgi:uncharacterized membrane protein YfcA
MNDLLLFLLVVATSALSGVLGMAGGMILAGVLSGTMPVPAAMVLHGVAQLASNGSRAAVLGKHVHGRALGWFLLGLLLAAGGAKVLQVEPSPRVVLGLLGVLPFAARAVRWRGDATQPRTALVAGAAGGVVQLVAGVSGPLVDLFFLGAKLDRHAIVATKSATQVLGHAVKIAFFAPLLAAGELGARSLLVAVAGAMLGTALGTRLLDRWRDEAFQRATGNVVLALGAMCLVRAAVA